MTTTPPRVLNYSTKIDPAQTVGEMQQMLATHGALSVNARYEGGKPVALAFSIVTQHGVRHYTLPGGDARPVLELLKPLPRPRGGWRPDMAQAERVAWRILKDWLEAQLALIATSMVSLDQVMLPYMVLDELGTTVYQRYNDQALGELEAADG